jgi:hypothetical protein
MLSDARVAYIPLRALAVNVIAVCSRSRRKPDSMTTVDPRIERLYSPDELGGCDAICCAMRGQFLRVRNAISTVKSRYPFARYSKMRNGGGITFGTIPDTPDWCRR